MAHYQNQHQACLKTRPGWGRVGKAASSLSIYPHVILWFAYKQKFTLFS